MSTGGFENTASKFSLGQPSPMKNQSNIKGSGSSKRLTKSDLMFAQNQISKLAKQTFEDLKNVGLDKKNTTTSDLVFEWCVNSARQILGVMNTRHQKSFVKKLGEQVSGEKLLSDLKELQSSQFTALRQSN